VNVTGYTRTFELTRDVVLAKGEEAVDYIHSQVSQNVDDMAIGESRLSFLLQPQGKVDALLRITRLGDSELVLDTDDGFGEAMTVSLARFKLRTKIEFERLAWTVLSVFGEVADDAIEGATIVVPGLLAGSRDILGESPAVSGSTSMISHEYEQLRIAAAFPKVGVDLDEGSIPNESGLVDRAVSFTKGCYRGQELVERIHSRGGNRRMLRALDVEGLAAIGAKIVADGREVGSVTSSIEGMVMAYVRGDVDPDAELVVIWSDDDGESSAAAALA